MRRVDGEVIPERKKRFGVATVAPLGVTKKFRSRDDAEMFLARYTGTATLCQYDAVLCRWVPINTGSDRP